MITNQMLKHLAITPNFSEAERFVCKELQVAPLEAVITNLQHKHGTTVEDAFKTYLGNNTDQAGINFWKQQFGNGPINVGQLAQLTNTQSGINTDTGGGGLLGTGIGPNVSLSDAAKLAALYYGGTAALDALGTAGAAEAAGSTGTGLTVGAGNTGLGLTLPEATTGLGMTAPAGAGLSAGSALGTDLATAAGIGTGIGTLSPVASGTGSLLAGTTLSDIGAGTLGAGIGGAGGVAAAGALGYAAGAVIGNLMDTDSTQNILKLMPGTYQGKFALSKKASTKGLRDKYQKKGGVFIVENYGSVSDPDLCYIGHSTYNTECIRHSIGYAILRKLFKKGAGCDISTPYEVLPLKSHNASGVNAFKIIYHCRDTDGTEFNYGHDIDAAESLHTLLFKNAGGFCLYDFLNSALLDNNAQNIEDIFLYSHDNVLAGRLDMSKEVLNIAMSSHMVIQNRTKGAGETGATVTTAIDVQPLKGPVYEFSIPIL